MMIYYLLSFLVTTAVLAKTAMNNGSSNGYYNKREFAEVVKLPTFIDKSEFIWSVYPHTTPQLVIAIFAPRRFGKTINLDMLRRFFSAECDQFGNKLPQHKTKYYETFKRLKIWIKGEEFTKKHFAQYPVLWIDFTNYIRSDYESALQDLTLLMYKQHAYLARSDRLDWSEKMAFNFTLTSLSRGDKRIYSEGADLMRWLKMHYNRSVIILFDEMDAPALKALFLSEKFGAREEYALERLSTYFRSMLKNNGNLFFSIFSGTSRIGNIAFRDICVIQYESVFDYDKIASFYGFSDEDVLLTAEHMGRLNMVNKIRNWYSGYKVLGSRKTVYNPLSVTASLTTGVVKSFWDAGTDLDNLKELFGYHVYGKEVEDSLFAPIFLRIPEKISMEDLLDFKKLLKVQKKVVQKKYLYGGRSVFFQYLFEQGYYKTDEMKLERTARIEISNEETRQALKDKLYTPKYFQEKYMVNFDVINYFVTSLKYLNATEASVKRLKNSIADIFQDRIPKAGDELRANLYHMARTYGSEGFKLTPAEKYVKMSKGQREETNWKKLEKTSKGQTKKIVNKERKKDSGTFTDILVWTSPNAPARNADKHFESLGLGGTVKIIECKCNESSRAHDVVTQIVDNEYITLNDGELNPRKKEIKGAETKTIQYIGVSYTEKYSWEVCVLFNTTNLDDKICA